MNLFRILLFNILIQNSKFKIQNSIPTFLYFAFERKRIMVEIIPKPAEKKFDWQSIIFYFSFGLLLMVVLSYFILSNEVKKAETISKNLEETLAREKTDEEKTLEKEVLRYQKKIEDFSKLINQHLFPSKFFEFIEKNTHPQVWFFKLDLNPREGKANLIGESESFQTVHQQLRIFENNPLVKKSDLVKIAIGKEDRVNFELNLDLEPKLFK